MRCAVLLVAAGCATEHATRAVPVDGVEELSQGLADLSSQCSYAAGVMQLVLEPGDVAWLVRDTDGSIDVNGFACAVKPTSIHVIEGSAGAQTLIVDLRGGVFGLGHTGTPGLTVALGGTTGDTFKLIGTSGSDRFTLGSNGIALDGDTTVDIVLTGALDVTVNLDDGNDIFSAAGDAATGAAFAAPLDIYGGAGNDSLRGGAGPDALYGGDGDDTLVGGPAADGGDALNGGPGKDTADYSARTANLTLSRDGAANDGAPGEGDNIASDIEVLRGGAGDDTFDEGSTANGAEILDGGPGTDTVSYAQRAAAVTIQIDGLPDSGEPGEQDTVMTTVENAVGGSGDDRIVGSALANVLDGGPGNDTISGGAGNDVLRGGTGSNTLRGDAGDDRFDQGTTALGADDMIGGTGIDTVDYSARTQPLTVVMDGATGGGEASEGDIVETDVENVIGGSGDDTLTGNAGDNQLEGRGGVDTLSGLGGDDVLDGGAGLDIIDCGAGEGDIDLDPTAASATGCEL